MSLSGLADCVDRRKRLESRIDVRYLRATALPCVVELSRRFWTSGARFEEQRNGLFRELRERASRLIVIVPEVDRRMIAEELAGRAEAVAEGGLLIASDVPLNDLRDALQRGEWFALFLTGDEMPPLGQSTNISVEQRISDFLRYPEVGAVIAAWFDDTEWLVGMGVCFDFA